MAKRQTWYDRGYAEGCEGVCDAPYEPGNRHHAEYMAGNMDGEFWLSQQRDRGDYHGTRTPDEDEA